MRGNPLRPSLTVRRSLFALLVTALATLALGGAIGFAAASDEGADAKVPSEIMIPAPHVGDAGTYTDTLVDLHHDGLVVPRGPTKVEATFAWSAPSEIRLADGRTITADVLTYDGSDLGTFVVNGEAQANPTRFYFDAAGSIVAREESAALAIGTPGANAWQLDEDVSGTTTARIVRYTVAPTWDGFCGIVHELQGSTTRLDGPADMLAGCSTPGGLHLPRATFKAVATQVVGDRETVVFLETSVNIDQARRVWFAPDVPYPVRILAPATDVLETAYHLFELTDLRLGGTEIGQIVPPEPSSLGPPDWQPWDRRTLPEAGIAHTFPLSAAIEKARADPSSAVGPFLEDHPDAFVTLATYHEDVVDARTDRTWMWHLTDGQEGFTTCLRRTDQPPSPAPVPIPSAAAALPPSTTYRTLACDSGARTVPARFVPAQVPTVSWLQRVWAAYAGPEYAGLAPNAWSFELYCADPECTRVDARFGAGVSRALQDDFHDATLPAGPGLHYRFDRSVLQVDLEGRVVKLDEARQVYETRPLVAGVQPTDPPADMSVASRAVAPPDIWNLPTGAYAVATGLFALLGGLMYWLWPSLKGAAAGLFSRVEKPTALDQPTRARLTSLVEANPGIHFQEIARQTQLGGGTLDHHLRKLVEVGILTQQNAGGYTCYFAKGAVDRRLMAAAPVLKADGARAVLAAVVAAPNRSGRELSVATGLDPGTVSYHLKKLQGVALVSADRVGREVRVAATDLGRSALGTAA